MPTDETSQPTSKRVYLSFPDDWDDLSEAEKREAARKMADILISKLAPKHDDQS